MRILCLTLDMVSLWKIDKHIILTVRYSTMIIHPSSWPIPFIQIGLLMIKRNMINVCQIRLCLSSLNEKMAYILSACFVCIEIVKQLCVLCCIKKEKYKFIDVHGNYLLVILGLKAKLSRKKWSLMMYLSEIK